MICLAVKAGTVTVYAVNHDAFENHFAFDRVKPVDLSLEVRTGIAAVEAHLKIIAAFTAGAHLYIKVLIIGSELPMCNLVDAVRAEVDDSPFVIYTDVLAIVRLLQIIPFTHCVHLR